ncbi:MAG: hypothetical protein DRQ60_05765 [Gammaproteobacteria bacterium]|nr:MAG: hypothetical protein DRQ54_03175 [Gammaproteobacteria bacterium]RLA14425.1 MAG: hypothetical protein DRQ52_04270 [Gammaproteobacteria bacterium]RLA15504.1 MAG: hypothetical protein DRQ60_05765 [Gammaproteobacteria bacterium]
MQLFPFTDAQQAVIDKVEKVAAGFASRAADYDEKACMPEQDILDMHEAGMLLSSLDTKYGGLGYGVHQDDPLCMFLTIEHLAMVNPATAHCFQVHSNCIQMISKFCTEEQVMRFTEPTRTSGKLMPAAGSEPTSHIVTGGMSAMGQRVEGGFLVNATKHYVTNAPGAELMWVMVKDSETERDIMLMIPANDPGITTDESFWDPIGMRACVSPQMTFKDVFVPQENLLGSPGDFFGDNWLGKINLGFTATYVGAMRGIYEYVIEYMKGKGRGSDVQRQQYVGEMKSRIDAIRLLLYTAVTNFKDDQAGAMLMVEEAKWLAVESSDRFSYLLGQAAGSTLLMRKHPVERLMRDLHLHILHGRHFLTMGVVGKAALGEPYMVGMST